MNPRIALIHATPLAVEPINASLAALWPEATAANLLDDSLSTDRARTGVLDETMFRRFETLVRYAVDSGADAILFTCSAFGPAIERAAHATDVPVLKPNEAMFDDAIDAATVTGRIGMVATFAPSIGSMRAEFDEAVAACGFARSLTTALAEGAMEAMKAGDAATHDRLITEAAMTLTGCDVIMLAQFSMARAAAAVEAALQDAQIRMPVFTSPDSAVRRLRAVLDRR